MLTPHKVPVSLRGGAGVPSLRGAGHGGGEGTQLGETSQHLTPRRNQAVPEHLFNSLFLKEGCVCLCLLIRHVGRGDSRGVWVE